MSRSRLLTRFPFSFLLKGVAKGLRERDRPHCEIPHAKPQAGRRFYDHSGGPKVNGCWALQRCFGTWPPQLTHKGVCNLVKSGSQKVGEYSCSGAEGTTANAPRCLGCERRAPGPPGEQARARICHGRACTYLGYR